MADSYTVRIQAIIDLLGSNIEINAPQDTGTPIYAVQSVIMASGDNSITVPAGATFMIILHPSASVNTKILKGDAADVGITTRNKQTLIPVNPAATIIINSSGLDTLPTKIFFF